MPERSTSSSSASCQYLSEMAFRSSLDVTCTSHCRCGLLKSLKMVSSSFVTLCGARLGELGALIEDSHRADDANSRPKRARSARGAPLEGALWAEPGLSARG